MDLNVPYIPSVKNLHAILTKVQQAAVPEAFGVDFLRDLGFASSNDRSVIRIFKYLGLIDSSGRPQAAYRDFVDHTKTKIVLAERIRAAFDDLYVANKKAHEQSANELKGWFKSKTGKGEPLAEKMATTFKSLSSFADFSQVAPIVAEKKEQKTELLQKEQEIKSHSGATNFGLVYCFEIRLPDTQNIDTFRAIFRALREELMQ